MKKFNPTQWHGFLLGGLMLCGVQFSAHAGIFTWSAPAPITTADATLNQTGVVVGGEAFATREVIVVLTNNSSIDFKADGSVAAVTAGSNGTTFGANTNNTGNYNFNTVLNEFNYDGGPKTITLNNLTAGVQYSVQLFALDDRGGTRPANFQDPADGTDKSATFNMSDNVYVVGTFTAGSSSVTIQENLLNGGGGNINALVIRQLSNLPVAPQIASQPQPATIYNGQTAQLTVAAYGTALTYQWQKSSVGGSLFTNVINGGRISGATNLTLTITNLAASDTGDYQVIVSNSPSGVVTSVPATLTVQPGTPLYSWSAPMVITTADATLNQTGTVIGAEVFGTAEEFVTLTNSTVIDFKADGSAAAVTAGGNGTASGAFSGNTSNANFNAVLTQFNYDGGPKYITLNNLTVGQQYTVQLFALDDRGNASSAVRANYQDPNDSVDVSSTVAMGDNVYIVGTFIANNSSMTIVENLPDNNGGGNINALVIRALGVVVPAQITSQPQSVTIDQSLNTSFTVAASGSTPFTYLWQRGVVGSGVFTNVPASSRISGQTSPTLTITNLTVGDTADYRVIVNNVANVPTNSSTATLTVQAVTPQFAWVLPAAITTADATLNLSGTIVGAEVFGPVPEIVVLSNGTSVDFKNDSSVATATGGGTFVGAFSGNTSNTTFNAVLNQASYEAGFNPIVPTKTITLNNLVAGQQYTVQLFGLDDRNGTSTRTVNFQDPNDANDYSSTFSMPNNVYILATFTASASSVNIQENLFGSGGNINALVVRQLSGLPLAPRITTQPQSVVALSGTNVQFIVGASGTSLTYQWQRATVGGSSFSNVGDANASGATTAQLTITNANTANAADYRVIVSNSSGSVTSSPAATLTFSSPVTTLTHRWSFNESSGTIAHDSIGGADGTLQGGATFTGSGYVNLPNPGSNPQTGNSYVQIPGGLLNNSSAVTIECWVTNNGWNNGNTFMGFSGPIDSNGFGTNYINFYSRMYSSISAFEISTFAGDSGLVALGSRYNTNSVASGIPDQYVYTYDPASGNVTLYIDGGFYATASGVTIPLSSLGTNVGTIGLSVYNQSQAYILPQNGGNKPNDAYFNGGFTEVRIYSGVLSSNAIATDYQIGPDQLPAATLTHRWSFSETSGVTAHDSVGGADGTLQGNAHFGGGYAVLPNTGSATDNSYVSIPGGLLNSYPSVTVECWVTNNGWANGNSFVGFGGQWNADGSGTNFIDFFARWYNAISAFQIQTTSGDSGIVNLGPRVNYNSIISPPSPTHYVYTYSPVAGTVTLYTNGVLSGTSSGVTIPLNSLGTNIGTIGLAVWNTNFAASIPNTSGNRPFMNAGVSEVRIYNGILTTSAIAADFQLGPDQLAAASTSNKPTLNVVSSPGSLTISWPTTNGGFYVESSPVLGPGAVWTVVSGNQVVMGGNYQITLSTTNAGAMFFRLHQ
jgi:hypothetical protein